MPALGSGRFPPWPALACDTLGFWCPLRSACPQWDPHSFLLAFPCSDIYFKQFSLAFSFSMKSVPAKELVGGQHHGQTELQQNLGKGPLYHLSGSFSCCSPTITALQCISSSSCSTNFFLVCYPGLSLAVPHIPAIHSYILLP